MKRILSICICLMLSISSLLAQNRTITGVVKDAKDGAALVGASVFVHQSDRKKAGIVHRVGTTTNAEGKFKLVVTDKVSRLYVSYIGYDAVSFALSKGRNDYEVRMKQQSVVLQDVVITGYQTLDRRKLTASVSKIDVNPAMVGAAKSIDQALAGQVAGMAVLPSSGEPGAPARIRIRGTASLSGAQDPLWVLDGIPLEGTDIPRMNGEADIANLKQSSIAGISPNDIEDITILKDAAATSIYGARAANGVIVITTKRGKIGKPVFNYNTKLTVSPRRSIDRLNLLNTNEKIDLELALMAAPDREFWGDKYPQYKQKGGVADILRKYSLFDAYRSGGWDALTPEAQAEIEHLRTINTDWNDILFRSSFTQEHNVSLSGGTERVRYYNSIGYVNEQGNVKGVDLTRFNVTSKTSYKVNRVLKVGASLFANRRKQNRYVSDQYGLSNPLYYSRTANPYQLAFNKEGGYVYDYNITNSEKPDYKEGFNIFEERANTSNKTVTTAINAIFDAELKFGSMWKLTSQLGLQWDKSNVDKFIGLETFNMRHIRENSKYDGGQKYLIPEGGKKNTSESTTQQVTWKAVGEFKNTFGELHDLQIMAGSELRKNWYTSQYSNVYGYDPKTLTSISIVFPDEKKASEYPLYGCTDITNAFASFFANGSYTFNHLYTLGASVRLDGSDLFGVDKKYRFLPIYSFSGLWRVKNQQFMQPAAWIDNLSLRLSYGLQGNIDKGTSPFLVGIYDKTSILPNTNQDIINILSAPNSKLRWEKTASYNAGIDFAVFKNAINMSVDYYYRRGTDLIGAMELPWSTGFTSMNVNWASMVNEGIEVNLTTRNITTKNFSWYTTFNFAYNRNEVLKMMIPAGQTTPSLEGYPVGAIFALKSQINPENGQILITPKGATEAQSVEQLFNMKDEFGMGFYSYDWKPESVRDMYEYVGTTDPPYTGGLMNTFTYKNWELNLNMAYNFGAKVSVSPSYDITNFNTGHNANSDILDRWTPENPNGKFPALLTAVNLPADNLFFTERSEIYHHLDMWVKPLNYVRLQNISLAYHIPEKLLNKLSLSRATVSLEGRNLLVVGSSYHNYLDPETMGNIYATPLPHSLTFNLNVSF